MIFTLTDRMYNVLDAYETDNYLIGQYVGSIIETLDINVSVRSINADLWVRGNYIMCEDQSGRSYWFTIYEDEDGLNDDIKSFYCYSGTIDVVAEESSPIKADKAQPFSWYFDRIFIDTGIKIGINEISGLSRKLEFTSENATNVEMLQYVLNGFDNAEAQLDVELSGCTPVKLVLNVHKRIGEEQPQALLSDKDDSLTDLTRKGSLSELGTCVDLHGAEADEKTLTLVGKYYEEKDAAGNILYYSPKESTRIFSVQAHKDYYVKLPEKANGEFDGYINRRYKSEASTQDALWSEGLARLKKIDHAIVEYNAKGNINCGIGDNVQVVSHNMRPSVMISARTIEYKFNDDDASRNEYKFSNYVELESSMDDLNSIINKIKDSIIYITGQEFSYCLSDRGDIAPESGWINTNPGAIKGKWLWIRTITTMSNGEVAVIDAVSYAALDGSQGVKGADGKDGATGLGVKSIVEQYYLSTSSTAQSGSTWGTAMPTWVSGKYIWTRSYITWSDNTTSTTTAILAGAINSANQTATEAAEVATAASKKDILVDGTQTAATGTWTGVANLDSLEDGQGIVYWLPYAGSGNATLNLTLNNGKTTGAVDCYYSGTTRLTTHYAAGNSIRMIYRKNVSIAGSATLYTGWWADANYSADTYDRVRINAACKAGTTGIYGYNLCMIDKDGMYHSITNSYATASGKARCTVGLKLDNIYYYNSATAVASGSTTTNLYSEFGAAINLRYSTNLGDTGTFTAYKPVYLVGTIKDDGLFYLDATWWTQTLPTTANGKVYIYIGVTTSTYQTVLAAVNTPYMYLGGKVQAYNDLAKAVFDKIDVNTLSAFIAELGTVNGGTMNGVSFNSSFTNAAIEGGKATGKAVLSDGFLKIDGTIDNQFCFKTSYGPAEVICIAKKGTTWRDSDPIYRSFVLTPWGLELTDSSGFSGALTAEALTVTAWKDLTYASGYTTAEDNKCQYRIFHQLDGTRLVRFRGQFKLSNGNSMPAAATYPFQHGGVAQKVPPELKPGIIEFGQTAASTGYGARLAITPDCAFVVHLPVASSYVSIAGLQYILT